ncbi:MAG: hypothetical protein M3R25_12895 [Bacteroidota bacterium]|nr:hypothetical protein [Bacteroidota bacterium]
MKRTFLAIIYVLPILFIQVALPAQTISRESIADSLIGWKKVYNYKGIRETKQVDAKLYTAAQLSICDTLANWMQATYIPKGGLGDVRKSVSQKLGLYNQHEVALPQSYGAYAKTYLDLRYNKEHKLEPANDSYAFWSVLANQVPGWPVLDIITPDQYYFTMPSFDSSSGGEEVRKSQDLSNNENLKPYINFWVKSIESGGGTEYVLLCKDNRSPFIKLTKGEYLQLLESAIPRAYEAEKKKIAEQNAGNPKSREIFLKALDDKNARLTAGLKNNRTKYISRLNEVALVSAQPTISDLDNARDIFSSGYITDPEDTENRVPIYKVDPVIAELCKKDKPQWILVSWIWSPTNAVEKHMHESIIRHFNFDYVYNFFFNPVANKGQKYHPN